MTDPSIKINLVVNEPSLTPYGPYIEGSWDQKIPNEPILLRNFLVSQPPIIPFERPSTTTCTRSKPVGKVDFTRRVSPQDELRAADYWHANTVSRNKKGVSLYSVAPFNLQRLDTYIAQYPERPWLRGIFTNIYAENTAKPYNVAVGRDCLSEQDLTIYETRGTGRVLSTLGTAPVFDINTSVKLKTRQN